MKYVVVVGDGMADYPLKVLKGKTPLEVASTPNMDFIASKGKGGKLVTIPNGMPRGSDVANLSLLGYNPEEYYTGRGPLEAASAGVPLGRGEVAFRCNFITEHEGKIEDFTAGHISSQEGKQLIELLNTSRLTTDGKFYTGMSYRNLFVCSCGADVKAVPPHDITGERIDRNLIKDGEDAELLNKIMLDSKNILEKSEVNRKRVAAGHNPANMIWLWGQGKKPELPDFKEVYNLRGAVISAVDLIKGLGIYTGLKAISVPGATGYYDTNYRNKADYTLKIIEEVDYCYIHIEAPDEAGHEGNLEMKIKAIEAIDKEIVGRLLDNLENFRIAVVTDHPTPIEIKTHTADAVPFAVYGPGSNNRDEMKAFSEKDADKGRYTKRKGWELTNILIDKSR